MSLYLANPTVLNPARVKSALMAEYYRHSVFPLAFASARESAALVQVDVGKFALVGLTSLNRWVDPTDDFVKLKDTVEKYSDYRYVDSLNSFRHKTTNQAAPTLQRAVLVPPLPVPAPLPVVKRKPFVPAYLKRSPKLPPRGLDGQFLPKKSVAQFTYWKAGEGETLRRVIVDDNNTDINYLKGFDLDRKDYRSFRRGSIVGLPKVTREYVDEERALIVKP